MYLNTVHRIMHILLRWLHVHIVISQMSLWRNISIPCLLFIVHSAWVQCKILMAMVGWNMVTTVSYNYMETLVGGYTLLPWTMGNKAASPEQKIIIRKKYAFASPYMAPKIGHEVISHYKSVSSPLKKQDSVNFKAGTCFALLCTRPCFIWPTSIKDSPWTLMRLKRPFRLYRTL